MKNGEMKTLREWIFEFKISPVKYTFVGTGNTYDTYKSEVKKDRYGYIDIFKKGGYGLRHSEVESYLDNVFFAENVDIHDVKLIEKFW